MARRSSRSNPIRSWSGTSISTVVSVTTTQQVVTVLSLFTDFPETLLRSRGSLLIQATPDAADENDILGIGLIVVNEAASSAGGVSVPGPLNDIDADWLWHQGIAFDSRVATSYTGDHIGLNKRVEIDSKAMRRVARDQTIVLVAEAATGEFVSLRLTGFLRMLAQLS